MALMKKLPPFPPGSARLSKERGYMTGGRKTEILCQQLEAHNLRSMGPGDHTGLQASISGHSSHPLLSPHPPIRPGNLTDPDKRGAGPCHQRGYIQSQGGWYQVFQPDVLVPKSDGTWRPVINLKALNGNVVAHHFKMESIRTVKGLIKHVINTKKSVLQPYLKIEFLGFALDTQDMMISLPHQRLHSLRSFAGKILAHGRATIRQLARLLGMMTAAHPAILPAPLHYRHLERAKIRAARRDPTYASVVHISTEVELLKWWTQQSQSLNGRPLRISQWDVTIESDASLTGRGASCSGRSVDGLWTQEERTHHINFLELKAAFLGLKTFMPSQGPWAALLLIDNINNITAIAFLNLMGGTHSLPLSGLAAEVWEWCIRRKFTIHAEHLPGVENIRADWMSRYLVDWSDWRLNRDVFLELDSRLRRFSTDLFASRTNAQLETYCSWKPDPGVLAVDALSIAYMFPPFSLIPPCLAKTLGEEASAVLIAPVWPNQTWFPKLLECLAGLPILLPPWSDIVTNPERKGGQRVNIYIYIWETELVYSQ